MMPWLLTDSGTYVHLLSFFSWNALPSNFKVSKLPVIRALLATKWLEKVSIFYLSSILVNWNLYGRGRGSNTTCRAQPLTSISCNLKCCCQMRCLFLCLSSLRENFGSVLMFCVAVFFFCWQCTVHPGAENPDRSLCFLYRHSVLTISLSTSLMQHNWQPNLANLSLGSIQD